MQIINSEVNSHNNKDYIVRLKTISLLYKCDVDFSKDFLNRIFPKKSIIKSY